MKIRHLPCILVIGLALSTVASENRSADGINLSWFDQKQVDAYDGKCVKEGLKLQCHIRGLFHMLTQYEKLIGQLIQLDEDGKSKDIQQLVKQVCPFAVRDFPKLQDDATGEYKKVLDLVFIARAGTCHLAKELAKEKDGDTMPSLKKLRVDMGDLAKYFGELNLLYPNFHVDPLPRPKPFLTRLWEMLGRG